MQKPASAMPDERLVAVDLSAASGSPPGGGRPYAPGWRQPTDSRRWRLIGAGQQLRCAGRGQMAADTLELPAAPGLRIAAGHDHLCCGVWSSRQHDPVCAAAPGTTAAYAVAGPASSPSKSPQGKLRWMASVSCVLRPDGSRAACCAGRPARAAARTTMKASASSWRRFRALKTEARGVPKRRFRLALK